MAVAQARLLAQPESRRPRVVLDKGRYAELGLEQRAEGEVSDAQVDGHADRAILWVDVAGNGDAHRGDLLLQLALGAIDQSGNLAHDRRPVCRGDLLVEHPIV